jgi:hypothetical protein
LCFSKYVPLLLSDSPKGTASFRSLNPKSCKILYNPKLIERDFYLSTWKEKRTEIREIPKRLMFIDIIRAIDEFISIMLDSSIQKLYPFIRI